MPDNKCPTCHSNTGSDPKKIRVQGEEGTDANGNPIPRWSCDPVKTANGFSGSDYKGTDRIRKVWIEELQADRLAQESDAGISPLTSFTALSAIGNRLRALLFVELRESTEKILNTAGVTLNEYFNKDTEGNPVVPGPNDSIKQDWTDVDRGRPYIHGDGSVTGKFTLPDGTKKDAPTTPQNGKIRAIWFEDLRHSLSAGWAEYWSVSPVKTIANLPDDRAGYVSVYHPPDDLVINYDGQAIGTYISSYFNVPYFPDEETTITEVITNTVINPTTEENPPPTDHFFRAFPTDFDVVPSDAGNKYYYEDAFGGDKLIAYPDEADPPQPQRIWIIQGNCNEHVRSLDNRLIIFLSFFGPMICYRESQETHHAISDAKVEIIEGGTGRTNANTLKLTSHSNSVMPMNYTDLSLVGANSAISATHIWQMFETMSYYYNYPIPDDFTAKANRKMWTTKVTCFKFDVSLEATRSLTKNDIAGSTYDPDTEINTWNATPGTTKTGGFFSTDSELNAGCICVFTCLLVLVVPNVGVRFMTLVFDDPPASAPPGAVTTVTAPYGGQTFTIYKSILYTYLGQHSRYNLAINIDDLCWVFFNDLGYTSQKAPLPGGGSSFIWTKFMLVTNAVNQIGSSVDNGPIIVDLYTDPKFIGMDFTTTIHDADAKATATVNAIRIENNDHILE